MAGLTAPPVPDSLVSGLDGVHVAVLAPMPVIGLMSASQPSCRGGDILINGALSTTDRRMALLRELKHVIDRADISDDGLCAHFAESVLMPALWLRDDWRARQRDPVELADRYLVPLGVMQLRLLTLGLLRGTAEHAERTYCQFATVTSSHSTGVGNDLADEYVA